MMQTVTVLTRRLPEAQSALDKLVRKAARLGVKGVGYTVGRAWEQEKVYLDASGFRRRYTEYWTDLEVSAEPLKVGDYTFVARLEVTPDGTLVDGVPGAALEPKWMTWAGDCEHCRVNRRRSHLFVVQDAKTGRQMAVGRSCLRAFLGTDTPSEIAAHFAFWGEVSETGEESTFGGFRTGFTQPLDLILAMTSVAVRMFGWCSKAKAAERECESTASHVYFVLGRPRPRDSRPLGELWDRMWKERSAQDEETAAKVLAYIRSDAFSGEGEYAHNLKILFQRDCITDEKRLGLIVSAYAAWMKTQAKPEVPAPVREQQWVGEVGQRLKALPVELLDYRVIGENAYGNVVLVTFRTQEGDLLKWFTGASPRESVHTQVRLTGTVKAHNEYLGRRETLLTRCVIAEAE
jgi:hypothetical protein